MINGITVKLHVHEKTGEDELGAPIYTDDTVDVKNVLVSPVSSVDNINNTSLYGKTATYQLAIPKRDTHVWEDTTVEFFNQKWHTFGFEFSGIDENIPGPWNAKVQVERHG